MMNEQYEQNDYNVIQNICKLLLLKGFKEERPYSPLLLGVDTSKILPELEKIDERSELLAAKLLLLKIPSYGVKITPPDWLVYMLEFCANGNPGFLQLIYKELLVYINNSRYHGTGIPDNYLITTVDFSMCFPNDYPILLDPTINDKYSKLWDKQKRKDYKFPETDNLVDTKEYWLEVMENKK